ncbi:MAG: hypothetical protein ACQEXJ_22170 [Myxococcota bacterium]
MVKPTVLARKPNADRIVLTATPRDRPDDGVTLSPGLYDASACEVLATSREGLLADLLPELAGAERLDVDRNHHIDGL